VAIPQGPLQEVNAALLDLVLGYYDVQPQAVKRVFLDPVALADAIRHKHVAAVLAVGPVGPGPAVAAVATVAKASGGTPTLLALSDADAFNRRFPAFESFDVPEGAFKARPSVPDDTVTMLAVTYRLVAPDTMLNIVAGAIGQTLFTSKARLSVLAPMANQIEAPDPDDKNPILPVHPGVANYLNNGDQSFFDEFQGYFYLVAAVLSVIGSLATIIMGRIRTGQMRLEEKRIVVLIQIADQTRAADAATLAGLDRTLHDLVDEVLAGGGRPGGDSALTLAINHARYSIDARRAVLREEAAQMPAARAA
jgi:hypothetical protein